MMRATWEGVYRDIREAVYLVLKKDFNGAYEHYRQMVNLLKRKVL